MRDICFGAPGIINDSQDTKGSNAAAKRSRIKSTDKKQNTDKKQSSNQFVQ